MKTFKKKRYNGIKKKGINLRSRHTRRLKSKLKRFPTKSNRKLKKKINFTRPVENSKHFGGQIQRPSYKPNFFVNRIYNFVKFTIM